MRPPPPRSTLFPYTTLFRSLLRLLPARGVHSSVRHVHREGRAHQRRDRPDAALGDEVAARAARCGRRRRSEEHTSELQSRQYLVCRLLLEKKKTKITTTTD